jgi:23S rRNA (guanine2445-N2)-methyltransferase / 23S rRNA (guanine2069-N7)-methyltransferase
LSRRRAPSLLSPLGEGSAEIFVRCPRHLEALLEEELRDFGIESVQRFPGGLQTHADLSTAIRICFRSRIASRVLWPLARFAAPDADALYAGAAALDWASLIRRDSTFAVGFDGTSASLRHTRFSALRIKDAVVDVLRSAWGVRPDVSVDAPDIQLQGVLHRDRVTLYLDLAGTALHRRGWRMEVGEAPLKENLAAGLLLAGGWTAGKQGWLVDPLCGAGTLLVEGALIAAGIPPGVLRERFGFEAWFGAPSGLLTSLREPIDPLPGPVRVFGRDRDPEQVRRTRAHLAAAGVGTRFAAEIDVEVGSLEDFAPPAGPIGLVVSNPPYGARLAPERTLATLGDQLRRTLPGAAVAIIVGPPRDAPDTTEREVRERLGLRELSVMPCRNGPLPAFMLTGTIEASGSDPDVDAAARSHAQMFANRIRKNAQRLGRWAKREGLQAFRLYDRDLPEYALVVDRYLDSLCVQEFAPPAAVDPVAAARRREAALAVLPEAAGVAPERVFFRTRRRQRPESQYEVQGRDRIHRSVLEFGAPLLVNLSDYLDTGLYLDSRGVRRLVRDLFAQRGGGRFLNLFAYTCTATVQAARGGATQSLSVDLSRTYLDWARENFALNGMEPGAHALVRADVPQWLETEAPSTGAFDVILLDPPTFSNSARTEGDLDLQRDHGTLLDQALACLAPDGVLLFVVHARRFRMAWTPPPGRELTDITKQTLDPDCARGRPAHRTWQIR